MKVEIAIAIAIDLLKESLHKKLTSYKIILPIKKYHASDNLSTTLSGL